MSLSSPIVNVSSSRFTSTFLSKTRADGGGHAQLQGLRNGAAEQQQSWCSSSFHPCDACARSGGVRTAAGCHLASL